jgi:hypothetical protein
MPRGKFAKNLAGQRFGKLLVLERLPNTRKGMAKWLCRCDCGKTSVPITSSLLLGRSVSCGCHRLTVIGKIKICSICKEKKLHKEFYVTGRKKHSSDYIASFCKVCAVAVKREQYRKNAESIKARIRWHRSSARMDVLGAYGGKCKCCGETEEKLLAVDHVHNNGAEHRKEKGMRGASFYRWIRRQGYPDDYQILCCNCNWGKYRNKGLCPHKEVEFIASMGFGA